MILASIRLETFSVPILIIDEIWFGLAIGMLVVLLLVWTYRFILRLVPLFG